MSAPLLVELASMLVLGFCIRHEARQGTLAQSLPLLLVLACAAAWGEASCIRLYGFYQYHPDWHLKVDDVMPLMVATIWPFVILSDARVVAEVIPEADPRHPFLTGLVVTWNAALMETVAVQAGLWSWNEPGVFQVPLIGILGWGFFAGSSLWLYRRLPQKWTLWTVLLAPLLTHLLLLVTWWGGLRWVLRGPLDPWLCVGGAWGLSALVGISVWKSGLRLSRAVLLPRIPAALVFLGLLGACGRDNLPLLAFAASFVPPYLLALRR